MLFNKVLIKIVGNVGIFLIVKVSKMIRGINKC